MRFKGRDVDTLENIRENKCRGSISVSDSIQDAGSHGVFSFIRKSYKGRNLQHQYKSTSSHEKDEQKQK
jgi:hypothetical protein